MLPLSASFKTLDLVVSIVPRLDEGSTVPPILTPAIHHKLTNNSRRHENNYFFDLFFSLLFLATI